MLQAAGRAIVDLAAAAEVDALQLLQRAEARDALVAQLLAAAQVQRGQVGEAGDEVAGGIGAVCCDVNATCQCTL